MTERWVSTPKFWCKYCRMFVTDNKIQRSQHESGPKHKSNVERFMRELKKNEDIKNRETQQAQQLVAKIGRMAGSAYAKETGVTPQFAQSTHKPPPVFVHNQPKPKPLPTIATKFGAVAMPAAPSNPIPGMGKLAAPRATGKVSESTGIGEWQVVEPSISMIPATRAEDEEDPVAGSVYEDPDKGTGSSSTINRQGRGFGKESTAGSSSTSSAPIGVDESLLEEEQDHENLSTFKLKEKHVSVSLGDDDDGGDGESNKLAPVFKKRKKKS